MNFSAVTYKSLNGVVAQVDRTTGELFIDPSIWKNLPAEVKDYVLLHEDGHITLQTADEFQANKYAIGRFMERGTLTDQEFGRRIVVLSEILGEKGRTSYFKSANVSNFDPSTLITSISGSLSSIFNNLPALGVGSFSRRAEGQQQATNAFILQAKSAKATNTMIMMVGGFAIIIVVILVLFKKS